MQIQSYLKKDSLPPGWQIDELKRFGKIINGSTPRSDSENWNGDIEWVTPDDLGKNDQKIIHESHRKITEKGYKSCGTEIVPSGSIIISSRAPIGHLAVTGVDMCFNQGCKGIVIDDRIDADYLFYQLSTSKEILNALGQGTTFIELSKTALGSLQIFVPSLDEQKSIAAYLDERTARIDRLMERKEKLLLLLAEKRTALITQAVTRGLDPAAPLKDSGLDWLGPIPQDWEVKSLKFSTSYIGSGKTPKGGATVYSKEGIMLLRSQNIYNDSLRLKDVVYINEDLDKLQANTRVEFGDVLLNITGASIGRTNFVPVDFPPANVNQHVCIIRPVQTRIKTRFLHYLLVSQIAKSQISSHQIGSSREGLNFVQVGNLKFPICKPENQKKIIDYLDSKTQVLDSSAKKIKKSINQLKEYRSALITAAVSGSIKV